MREGTNEETGETDSVMHHTRSIVAFVVVVVIIAVQTGGGNHS